MPTFSVCPGRGPRRSRRQVGPPPEFREATLNAAGGLTTMAAENAFALLVIEFGTIQPSIVAREKVHALKKSGLLEVVDTRESLDSIGGLDALKGWLAQRYEAFTRRAQTGLPRIRWVGQIDSLRQRPLSMEKTLHFS